MEKSEEKNYYELLGVQRDASLDEIKQSFKDIVVVYHPDSNFFSEIVADSSNSPEELLLFKKITEAYQTLINKDKRGEYDKRLNKTDLAKGRQSTTDWIRPDGSNPKTEERLKIKNPTITDLQIYQKKYKERELEKSRIHSVAEILEETEYKKKINVFLFIVPGVLLFVGIVASLLIII